MTGWPNTSPPSIPPLRSSASTGSGYFAVITYFCHTRNHWYPLRLTISQFAILSDSPPLILAATTRREECGKIISQQSTPSSSLSTLVIGDNTEMRYHLFCCEYICRHRMCTYQTYSFVQGSIRRVQARVGVLIDRRAALKLSCSYSRQQDRQVKMAARK